MPPAPPFHVCRHEPMSDTNRPRAVFVLRPALVAPQETAAEPAQTKRRKIWEFASSLHCSIIGTCLSTGELRQVLGKLGLAPSGATDHDLHGTAVARASRHDATTKLLNKALDQRHRLAINQFAKAREEAEVRVLWREAVGRGDIPGAYWAVLTHPATTNALLREAFGEVHMLSHLVGAANRADIRRLRELEVQQAELEAKLTRQQIAFREAVVERDARIQQLQQALAQRIRSEHGAQADRHHDGLAQLIADLEKRLAAEAGRRVGVEERLVKARNALDQERAARRACEQDNRELNAELEAIEATLSGGSDLSPTEQKRLDGMSLLYVGGRPHQVAHLRAVSDRLGAEFLHHDGGKEQHQDLLAGLISRADLVLFPVDCISHDAALTVKRVCRQAGKAFVPLRSASVASFVAALRTTDAMITVSEAAD